MPAPLRVLLVEDNEGDEEMTERAVRDLGGAYHLSVAHDGAAALDLLMRRGQWADAPRPDIILLDINMPRMDGKRFLEVVKADPELKVIPVVMLTSSQSPGDLRACYERHANAYVVKPFDAMEFIDTVKAVLTFWRGTIKMCPAH